MKQSSAPAAVRNVSDARAGEQELFADQVAVCPDLAAAVLDRITHRDPERRAVAAAYQSLSEKWGKTDPKRGRVYRDRGRRVLWAMESRRLVVDDGGSVRLESERSDVRGDPQTERREAARLASEIRAHIDDPWRFAFFSFTWGHTSDRAEVERRRGLQAWDRMKTSPAWERWVKGGVCVDDCTYSSPDSRARKVRLRAMREGWTEERMELEEAAARARRLPGGESCWFHPHFHGLIEWKRATKAAFVPEQSATPEDWFLVDGLQDSPDYRSAEAAVHRWIGERGGAVPESPAELCNANPAELPKWLQRARKWVRSQYLTTAAEDRGAFLFLKGLGRWKGGIGSVAREIAKYSVPVGKMGGVEHLAEWLECLDNAHVRRRFGTWRESGEELKPEDLGDVPEQAPTSVRARIPFPSGAPGMVESAALLVLLDGDYGLAMWTEGLPRPSRSALRTSRAVLSALTDARPPPTPIQRE